MGAYLTTPVRRKFSEYGENEKLIYGCTEMQGWRVAQEDAHNCIMNFDENTSLFAVYDGHGGPEISEFAAFYLPRLIKTSSHWSQEQKLNNDSMTQCLIDSFLKFDAHLIQPDTIDELRRVQQAKIFMRSTLALSPQEDDVDENTSLRYGRLFDCGDLELDNDTSRDHRSHSLNDRRLSIDKNVNFPITPPLSPEYDLNRNRDIRRQDDSQLGAISRQDSQQHHAILRRQDSHQAASSCKKPSVNLTTIQLPPSTTLTHHSRRCSVLNSSFYGSYMSRYVQENVEEHIKTDNHQTMQIYDEENGSIETVTFSDGDTYITPGIDSGSTACVLIIRFDRLYVANVGDSRCVLCRNGCAVDLSLDHKPEDPLERARIEQAGGYLDAENRINGTLNLSRSFGDHSKKTNSTLPIDKQMVSPYPDVRVETLQPGDRFAIVACDGIWNTLTSQELVDLVSQRLSKGLSPVDVSKEVCDMCLAENADGDDTGCDNMTIIIVKFKENQRKSSVV